MHSTVNKNPAARQSFLIIEFHYAILSIHIWEKLFQFFWRAFCRKNFYAWIFVIWLLGWGYPYFHKWKVHIWINLQNKKTKFFFLQMRFWFRICTTKTIGGSFIIKLVLKLETCSKYDTVYIVIDCDIRRKIENFEKCWISFWEICEIAKKWLGLDTWVLIHGLGWRMKKEVACANDSSLCLQYILQKENKKQL